MSVVQEPLHARNAAASHTRLQTVFVILTAVLLTAGLVWRFITTQLPVTIWVDGYSDQVYTHQRTVRGLLEELNLPLAPEDQVNLPLDHALTPGLTVEVTRARVVLIAVDGNARVVRTHARRVGDIWSAAGIEPGEMDERFLEGVPVTDETLLPTPAATSDADVRYRVGRPWVGKAAPPLTLSLRRAVPLTVLDEDMPLTFMTTAPTVGEALRREQFVLYLGDIVQPSLGSPVRAGERIFIQRSLPVVFFADGDTLKTRTRQHTVGDALAEQGIVVAGLDEVEPALTTPLVPNLAIRVVRIQEVLQIEQQIVPFTSIWVGDDQLDIDQRRVSVPGQEGIQRQRYRIRSENDQEKQVIERTLEDSWVAQEPITRVLAYGRRITPKTLETPEGPITYWRHVRAYTTSYTAASAGVPKTNPAYGRTRIGLPLRTGIVAVDPTLIPLRSWLYVPGYGKGLAGDTGGAVKGKFVDLGFSEGEYESWHWWSDVYLLWPPPPTYQIRWVLPDWPKYPDRRR
jgi:uncharacterized protein YabE (DUF348 family)/3D (Asp-Asp-Asp) domain-containing protein